MELIHLARKLKENAYVLITKNQFKQKKKGT